jgi:hypothetical protein
VVSADDGIHVVMTGEEYEAKYEVLPTTERDVTTTGRTMPTPETNMAATQESDTH